MNNTHIMFVSNTNNNSIIIKYTRVVKILPVNIYFVEFGDYVNLGRLVTLGINFKFPNTL